MEVFVLMYRPTAGKPAIRIQAYNTREKAELALAFFAKGFHEHHGVRLTTDDIFIIKDVREE